MLQPTTDSPEAPLPSRSGSTSGSVSGSTSGPTRRPRRLWPWLLLLAAIGAGGTAGYRQLTGPAAAPSGRGEPEPVQVGVATARRHDVEVFLAALGTVTPLQTVTVRSRVDGQIQSLHFTEGQSVHAGDLLAEIDPRPFAVQLAQAQGQLARDQALLDNSRADLERYETLLAKDSVARQQVDSQRALVHQYEGTVQMDKALIDSSNLQLDYARITASIAGRVGLRLVDPGNMVHASDANGLVVINQLQPISIVFTLPQDRLPAVLARAQGGEALPILVFDREGKVQLATGVLRSIDNQIDPTTGTIRLKAECTNTDERLFPNQFVNVRLRVDVRAGATVVPAAAVQRGAQGTVVYAVSADHTVDLRHVQVGPADGDDVVIEQGLEPGEVVVVDGTDRLRKGARVRTAPPADAGSKQGGAPPAEGTQARHRRGG
jgi:multidrug efflux system membrane fusion protein